MLSGKGRTNRYSALSVLLRALTLVVLSSLILLCLAKTAFAVDLTEENALTVNLQDGFRDDEGLKDEDLVVELYYVAQARDDMAPAKGYDTYILLAQEPFASLQTAIDAAQVNDPDAKEKWEEIAQQAASLVKDGKGGEPLATGHTRQKIGELPAGLYLVITHGTQEPYFEEEGSVLTRACSERYEYRFAPQLVAFPFVMSGEGMEEIFNTADAHGDWKHDLTIVLKGEREAIPPDEKPGTGDHSGVATQRILFSVSGTVILLFAVALLAKKRRN